MDGFEPRRFTIAVRLCRTVAKTPGVVRRRASLSSKLQMRPLTLTATRGLRPLVRPPPTALTSVSVWRRVDRLLYDSPPRRRQTEAGRRFEPAGLYSVARIDQSTGERVHVCHCSSKDLKQTASESTAPTLQRVAAVAAVAGLLFALTSTEMGASLRTSLMASWLGSSGFIAALSLIFLSEIGDKTFFICAILAMRLGRWISFLGTVSALGVMTILSVGLGVAFNAVPDAMKTSIPIGKYLSVGFLSFFGVRSIVSSLSGQDPSQEGGEFTDAEEVVERAAQSGQVKAEETPEVPPEGGMLTQLRYVFGVAVLIFVAEWGDRSMLTTIALGASQSPLGVALGGIIGHMLAAAIAVVGGSFISTFISERSVNLMSGFLFIIFAVTTALNWT